MATKTDQIRLRVATSDKELWSEVARSQGLSLSSWLCRLAKDEVKLQNSLEDDAEQVRAERRLLKREVYPHAIPAPSQLSGKKTYAPDLK